MVSEPSGIADPDNGAAGEDVVGVSLTENRVRCEGAVRGSGADCRKRAEGE